MNLNLLVYENETYELNKQEGLEIRFGFDCNEGDCFLQNNNGRVIVLEKL